MQALHYEIEIFSKLNKMYLEHACPAKIAIILNSAMNPIERGEKKDVNGQKEAVRREILAGGGEIGSSFLHTPQPAL
jgi:hypothetical protein